MTGLAKLENPKDITSATFGVISVDYNGHQISSSYDYVGEIIESTSIEHEKKPNALFIESKDNGLVLHAYGRLEASSNLINWAETEDKTIPLADNSNTVFYRVSNETEE